MNLFSTNFPFPCEYIRLWYSYYVQMTGNQYYSNISKIDAINCLLYADVCPWKSAFSLESGDTLAPLSYWTTYGDQFCPFKKGEHRNTNCLRFWRFSLVRCISRVIKRWLKIFSIYCDATANMASPSFNMYGVQTIRLETWEKILRGSIRLIRKFEESLL